MDELRAWERAVSQYCRQIIDEESPKLVGLDVDGAAAHLKILSTRMMDEIERNTFEDFVRAQSMCRPGCSHCCHVNVEAAWFEPIAIARLLLDESARRSTLHRIRDHAEWVWDATDEERRDVRRSCPFLVDDLCTIYATRPLMCRGIHAAHGSDCGGDGVTRRLNAPMEAAKRVGSALVRLVDVSGRFPPTSEFTTAVHLHLRRLTGDPIDRPPAHCLSGDVLAGAKHKTPDDEWNVSSPDDE